MNLFPNFAVQRAPQYSRRVFQPRSIVMQRYRAPELLGADSWTPQILSGQPTYTDVVGMIGNWLNSSEGIAAKFTTDASGATTMQAFKVAFPNLTLRGAPYVSPLSGGKYLVIPNMNEGILINGVPLGSSAPVAAAAPVSVAPSSTVQTPMFAAQVIPLANMLPGSVQIQPSVWNPKLENDLVPAVFHTEPVEVTPSTPVAAPADQSVAVTPSTPTTATPAAASSVLDDVQTWLTAQMISGVPNYWLALGAGGALLLMMFGGGKRRR